MPSTQNIAAENMSMEDFYFGYYTCVTKPNYWESLVGWYKVRLEYLIEHQTGFPKI